MLNACQISVVLIFLHFLSDWVLQSREMAKDKTKNFWAMCSHCAIVYIVVFLGTSLCGIWSEGVRGFLCFVNAIVHGLLDFCIWYIYAKLHPQHMKVGEVKPLTTESGEHYEVTLNLRENMLPNTYGFFTTIAIDQTMHLTILMLMFMPL